MHHLHVRQVASVARWGRASRAVHALSFVRWTQHHLLSQEEVPRNKSGGSRGRSFTDHCGELVHCMKRLAPLGQGSELQSTRCCNVKFEKLVSSHGVVVVGQLVQSCDSWWPRGLWVLFLGSPAEPDVRDPTCLTFPRTSSNGADASFAIPKRFFRE